MVWRAARVEALRLCTDTALAACLGLALLPAIAIVAGLPDGGAAPPPEALEGPLRVSASANTALLAAGFGAVRIAAAYRLGTVGRDALVLRTRTAFWMRVASSAAGGVVVGLGAWVFAGALACLFGHLEVFESSSPGTAVVMGAGGGVWGTAIGAVLRAPLAVVPVVILSLSPALLLSSLLPEAVIALPLGSALLALGCPIVTAGGDQWWAAVIAVLWLIGATGLSFALHRVRPVLG